jgi:hypothetical protein
VNIIEQIRAAQEKATPGPWHTGHLCNDSHSCNCPYIFDEQSYMGGIAEVYVDNGIASIADGANDCPPLEEAKANQRFIALAGTHMPALLAAADAAKELADRGFADARFDKLLDPVRAALAALTQETQQCPATP